MSLSVDAVMGELSCSGPGEPRRGCGRGRPSCLGLRYVESSALDGRGRRGIASVLELLPHSCCHVDGLQPDRVPPRGRGRSGAFRSRSTMRR